MNITQHALSGIATDGTGGTLDSPKLHLFQGSVPTDPGDPSSWTTANFSGYSAPSSISWSGPRTYSDNTVGYFSHQSFAGSTADPQVNNNVSGWYLCDTANANVLLYDSFAAPIPVTGTGSYVEFDIQIRLDPAMSFGTTVTE